MEENEITIDFTLPPNVIKDTILKLPYEIQPWWVAMWISQPNVLEDMRWRPIPRVPIDLKEENKKQFYEQKQMIRNRNWRNLKELQWAKSILKDEGLTKNIQFQINQFIDIEDHPEPINVKPDYHWQD